MRNHFFTASVAVSLAFSATASSAPLADKMSSGDVAAHGATFVAGPHGVRYELRGGAKVQLSEGAEFAFDPSLHLKLRKPGDPDTLTRVVHLLHGSAEVTVPTLRDPTAVMVRGPGKLSAVAKEGHLTFIADADRSTAAAREGEMLVGLGNDWRPLHAGFARTLAPEDPSALSRPVLQAPAVSTASKLTVVQAHDEAHAEASWTPLANVARYDVTLTRNGADAAVVSHQLVTEPKASMQSLTPGQYSLVVSAIDKQGLVGNPSVPCALRVVGIETPDGATTSADGAIIIGRDQRVSLLGAEGIELSYGSSSLFMAAPASLGLAHGEPTTVRFRAPGTTSEAVVHLAPRGLHAAITIGPRAAKWPLDRVAVQVDLYDTTGSAVPDDSDIDATVTVNLTKVPVKWERSGHTLRASVPSGAGAGPWVVRTEVKDGHGELLGRDFLEVAPLDHRQGVVAQR
ncbi:MAG TPA: hypothetical protein VH062_06340 [Polyangiaceae bacterium]|nr:hypothetical protein [Polyangiaceae bacterium]